MSPKDELKIWFMSSEMRKVCAGHPIVEEHQFDEVRKWRFDWAIPSLKIGIEYDGIETKKGKHAGAHTSYVGFSEDADKLNAAAIQGWLVIRFTSAFFTEKTRKKLLLTGPWQTIVKALESRLHTNG